MIASEDDKLKPVEAQVKAVNSSAKVMRLTHDFGRKYQIEDFELLYDKFKQHDVSILVNNVGYFDGNVFAQLSENSVHTMMAVNCYSVALLTKLMLDDFKKRNKEKNVRSLVVNHCSAASLAPMPYIQMYSATKVY